jgi:hypothetical protein
MRTPAPKPGFFRNYGLALVLVCLPTAVFLQLIVPRRSIHSSIARSQNTFDWRINPAISRQD